MTNYYYITGPGRGLGRALAQRLLAEPSTGVIGVGRSEGPVHAGYEQVKLDLADLGAVSEFRFPARADAERIVLVNNAAVLKPTFLGKYDARSIVQSYAVNIIAPVLLINAFIAAYGEIPAPLLICNVTSPAGSTPIAGAALYSATKAALNMTSRVLALETEAAGRHIDVLCVSPGSIDTDMQATLRNASPADFPGASRFRRTQEQGLLASPEEVAERLVQVLLNPRLAPETVFDLKDLPWKESLIPPAPAGPA